ncbi:MAG: hypothetical protein H0T79_16560 [Deltaproteobacteria bacterium]|nr:hypothetical protein [Deltaproteobacteria bacterium]
MLGALEEMARALWLREHERSLDDGIQRVSDETRDAMLVYADALLEVGDPRGDEIATDLRLGQASTRTAWLGPGGTAMGVATRAGLITLRACETDTFRDVVDGPDGKFIEHVYVYGSPDEVMRCLTLLSRRPRYWLHTLGIELSKSPRRAMPPSLIDNLITMTPNLQHVLTRGDVMLDLPHPRVSHLTATWVDAFAAVMGGGPPLPQVRSIDLAFDGLVQRPLTQTQCESILPSRLFPSLVRLDLSRNEPGAFEGGVDVFDLLRSLTILPQLEVLAMPTVRSPRDANALQAAVDRMPNLRTLSTPRPRFDAAVLHRNAKIAIGNLGGHPKPASEGHLKTGQS